jgi:hypothetical protein
MADFIFMEPPIKKGPTSSRLQAARHGEQPPVKVQPCIYDERLTIRKPDVKPIAAPNRLNAGNLVQNSNLEKLL